MQSLYRNGKAPQCPAMAQGRNCCCPSQECGLLERLRIQTASVWVRTWRVPLAKGVGKTKAMSPGHGLSAIPGPMHSALSPLEGSVGSLLLRDQDLYHNSALSGEG